MNQQQVLLSLQRDKGEHNIQDADMDKGDAHDKNEATSEYGIY